MYRRTEFIEQARVGFVGRWFAHRRADEAVFGVFVPGADEHALGGAILLVGESPVESG